MPARRVTIHDVARAARVSTTTVSDALAGRGRMSAQTRERVRLAAESIGYVASAAARNLRLGRAGSLGLYVPARTVGYDYYVGISRGAAESAFGAGFALTLVPAWDDPEQLRGLPLDGVIVSDPALDDPVMGILRSMPVPMVTCERDLSPRTRPVGVVASDHVAAMRELLAHLRHSGAVSVAVLAPGPETSFGVDIRTACREAGRTVTVVDVPLAFSHADIAQAVSTLRRLRPDAVVAVADGAALSVLHQLQELRVSVPGDVLLASYVDSPVLATCNPPVTGVDIDPRLTGTLAVEILVHALDGTGPAPSGTVPAVLRVRASTDPQPAERTSGRP